MLKSQKIIISAAIIILIGGLLFWFTGRNNSNNIKSSEQIRQEQITAALIKSIQTRAADFAAAKQNDSDLDGVRNADEIKFGTDPNIADTDGDGLLDGDEIKIYKTNPLKADTFGIGHFDGWGVLQGVILPGGKVNRDALKPAVSVPAPSGGRAPSSTGPANALVNFQR